MRKFLMALLPVMCLAVSGCQLWSDDSGGGGSEKIQSRALRGAVIDVLHEAMAHRRAQGEPLPPSADDPYLARSVADSIKAQFPRAFAVTTVQEKAFQQGRFTEKMNEDNREELLKLLRIVQERTLPLNTIMAELVRQHAAQPLSGLKLELAVRLLRAQVAT